MVLRNERARAASVLVCVGVLLLISNDHRMVFLPAPRFVLS